MLNHCYSIQIGFNLLWTEAQSTDSIPDIKTIVYEDVGRSNKQIKKHTHYASQKCINALQFFY